MGSDWTLKTIREFAEVKGGKRLPKGKRLSEKKTTHPYIRVVDFTDGRISLSNLLYVPEEVFPNIKRYIVESGDVVISIVGTIGLVATIPSELHEANLTENAAKILIEDTTVDSQYLSYYLKSSIGQHEIQRNTVGSTQSKLPLYGIKNIEVSYPPLPEQRAIAHILGSLDDKIELNRRMNQTLEAMARAIFKSWFVDFLPVRAKQRARTQTGDPVRAKAEGRPTGLPDEIAALFPDSFEDSELGEIPKGWGVKNLNEIANIIDCLHSKKPERQTEGRLLIQVFNVGDTGRLDFSNPYYISPNEYNIWIKRMEVQPGDIVITKTGRVGAVGQMPNGYKAAMGRNIVGIRATNGMSLPSFLKDLLLSDHIRTEIIRNTNDGTILQSLHVKAVNKLRVILPQYALVQAYNNFIKPIHTQLEINDEESRTLASLRDTLLPKLISGELRVPEAEKFVEEAGL